MPELLAVVVALAAPLKVTVTPLPVAVGLIVPEMLYVGMTVAVKFAVVMFAPLTNSGKLVGEKVYPDSVGVTV
jgi:hypothetical protein